MHSAIFVVVAALLFMSSRPAGSASQVSFSIDNTTNTTVDEVSSAEVAATIARGADLVIADNVSNLADSLNAQVDFATSHDSYLAKPQIVETDAASRADIEIYVAKAGDTVPELASKFNVSSETIRWANNLIGDTLSPGARLVIPPVNGVVVTVKAGDSLNSLATKYRANALQIAAFNDAEDGNLPVGERIVIPDGRLPQPVPTAVANTTPSQPATVSFAFGGEALYGGNGYAYGYCTWYAANKRMEIGRPIPRNLGNANTWLSLARSAGIPTGSKPAAGAVIWYKFPATSLGHVGFVERINSDGSIYITEMNVNGWNVVSGRTIEPSEFSSYEFIY